LTEPLPFTVKLPMVAMFVSSSGSRAATTAVSMAVVDRRRLDRCACAMGWSSGPPRSRGRPGRGFLVPRGMGAQRAGEESGERPLRVEPGRSAATTAFG
jgi:hypothetical protein